jgi:hypothetical protein
MRGLGLVLVVDGDSAPVVRRAIGLRLHFIFALEEVVTVVVRTKGKIVLLHFAS